MTEACCVDSQCLRRREWEYEDGDELDADGGDGPFPCREPCSLVIAAARKWAILESEEERTYELELTTSELNQLEELVDAVAEGGSTRSAKPTSTTVRTATGRGTSEPSDSVRRGSRRRKWMSESDAEP